MKGFGAFIIAASMVSSILCCANFAFASDTNSTTLGTAPVGNDLSLIDIGGFLRLLGGFIRVGISALGAGGGSGGGTSNFTWQELQVGDGGYLDGMSIGSDDTMVVRTDTYGGYVWDGSQWQQLVNANSMPASYVAHAQLFGSGLYDIQIAPSNSNVMYMMYYVDAGTYPPDMAVYVTSNKGMTWTQTNFTPIDSNSGGGTAINDAYRGWGPKIAIDPANSNIAYVGTPENGLFLTTDGGTSWSTVSGVPASTADGGGTYPGITGILFDPASTTVIYAASYGNGIYQSINGGTSWSKINGGGGPSTVQQAAISPSGTYGTYFVIDSNNDLWVYNGTWNEAISDGQEHGVAVDPFNSNNIVAATYGGQLDESLNDGSSWSGWSQDPTFVVNGLPWQTDTDGLHFDQVIPDKLYINGDRSFWTTTLSGTITTGTAPVWTEQGLGIEQLVANQVIVPPVTNSKPLLANWDSAVIEPNLTSYPSTIYPNSSLAAGWSIDYASNDPDFIAVVADGAYGGGPQESSYSTNDGVTWSPFPTTPYTTFGGQIAVASSTNILFDTSGGNQPYYTTDGGNTWNPVTLPGISSWSSFGSAYYDSAKYFAADRVNIGTFYIDFNNVGIFRSTNGGVSWTEVNNNTSIAYGGNEQLQATPGEAGDLWLSSGPGGNPGQSQGLAGGGGSLLHSTDGGATWTAIPSILEPYAVGFGAAASGQSYPAVYTVGWLVGTSTTSLTTGTGSQTLTVQTGLGYQAGNTVIVSETVNSNNSMTGTVTSYNSSTGSLVVNVTLVTGSGTHSDWTVEDYGIWESDNEGVTWKSLGQWPFSSLDTIRTISGDPNVYGKVYVGFGGSGYAYYSSDGPHIRTVAFSPSSGTEIVGSSTVLTLGLSEPVTVSGGTPTLTLDDGGTATYASGSGSSALVFDYTVQSGQATSSLAATAVNLNGATIDDSGSNAANLSLSGVTQNGPTINAAPPNITGVAESPSSGTLEPGSSVVLTLTMSYPVTVSGGTPTLTLDDGGTATYASGSGSSALVFDYTVQSGQATSSLAATAVNLNGATISNANGNANLSLSGLTQTGPQIVGSLTLALDGSAFSGAYATATSTVTLSTSNANDVVIVAISNNPNTTASVTDTAGLTWYHRADAGSSGALIDEYYATSSLALSNDIITVNYVGGGQPNYYAMEAFGIVGASTTAPFDTNGSIPGTSNNSTVTVSTNNANDFIFATYRFFGNGTAGSGWTSLQEGSDGFLLEYKIATTTQSNLTGTNSGGENGGIMDAIVQAP